MDFVERMFGVSPDGSNGVTETMYLVAAAALIAAVGWRSIVRMVRRRQDKTFGRSCLSAGGPRRHPRGG